MQIGLFIMCVCMCVQRYACTCMYRVCGVCVLDLKSIPRSWSVLFTCTRRSCMYVHYTYLYSFVYICIRSCMYVHYTYV